MAKRESRSHSAPATAISVAPAPPVASAIWITQPDGSKPVNCCFKVSGTSEPNTYIHVSISEIGGVVARDPHPSFVWSDDDGNWSVHHCVPTPPPIAAGTIIRIRACTVNQATGMDGHCVDVPVTLTGACPPDDSSSA
jgi:hypothetical protein